LVELEERLNKLDDAYSDVNCEDLDNGSFREEPKQDRADIIAELKTALPEYSE